MSASSKPTTLYDKIWDDHLVDDQPDGTCLLYIDRHLVHEVTTPAGLRRPAPDRAARCARRRRRSPWSTTTCRPPTAARPSPIRKAPSRSRRWRENAARVRRRIFRRVRPAPGHRPHHRPGAGLHPARHDHRLRRQPHLDPWRVRRAGAWHRHLRGRACAGDADADPAEGQEHARHRRRHAARRRHRQGHHPRHHRRDRHRRRHRPCASNMPARRSARCRWKAA